MRRLSIRSGSSQLPWRSRFLLLNAGASPQRILQIDWHATLLEQIGKGLVREFLQCHHPVPAQQCQRGQRFVVEVNQFTHLGTSSSSGFSRSTRRSRNLNCLLGLVLGGALAATTNRQQHFTLTFNSLACLLSLCRSGRPTFLAKAAF